MPFSVSDALHDWMHKRRIITLVAQAMGVKEGTLYAELRPSNGQAKLGADELVLLVKAVRAVGRGDEIAGIVHRYVEELKDAAPSDVEEENMVPHVLSVVKGLGMLSDCAAQISSIEDEQELMRLTTMVRTEILPVVLRMESLLESRLSTVRGRKKSALKKLLSSASPEPLVNLG